MENAIQMVRKLHDERPNIKECLRYCLDEYLRPKLSQTQWELYCILMVDKISQRNLSKYDELHIIESLGKYFEENKMQVNHILARNFYYMLCKF